MVARILMPALVSTMPMPSYAYQVKFTYVIKLNLRKATPLRDSYIYKYSYTFVVKLRLQGTATPTRYRYTCEYSYGTENIRYGVQLHPPRKNYTYEILLHLRGTATPTRYIYIYGV
jgi:hypothetical protein